MTAKRRTRWGGALCALVLAAGCTAAREPSPAPLLQAVAAPESSVLETVAQSTRQWTGVTVSKEGRLFVNYPRWSDDVPVSVAELIGGEPRPFPDGEWNRWNPSLDPGTHFVCVQSVVVDDKDRLWILDPANPKFAGVVPGGPKLVEGDPKSGAVKRVLLFPPEVAPKNSYLNDIRVDSRREVAYITDSGSGAILTVDLGSGRIRRLLADHPSTKSEGVVLTIGGKPWLRDGKPMDVHADGIALTPDGEYLYYQALTGRHLYRIPTRALRDENLSAAELGAKVETVGATGAADGLLFGPDGSLYITALEHDAIRRLTPDGRLETVAHDPRLAWPDTLALTRDGDLLVAVSQIHLGANPPQPYSILRISR